MEQVFCSFCCFTPLLISATETGLSCYTPLLILRCSELDRNRSNCDSQGSKSPRRAIHDNRTSSNVTVIELVSRVKGSDLLTGHAVEIGFGTGTQIATPNFDSFEDVLHLVLNLNVCNVVDGVFLDVDSYLNPIDFDPYTVVLCRAVCCILLVNERVMRQLWVDGRRELAVCTAKPEKNYLRK